MVKFTLKRSEESEFWWDYKGDWALCDEWVQRTFQVGDEVAEIDVLFLSSATPDSVTVEFRPRCNENDVVYDHEAIVDGNEKMPEAIMPAVYRELGGNLKCHQVYHVEIQV